MNNKLTGKRPTQSIFHDLEMEFFRDHVDDFSKIWEVCKPSFDAGEDSVKFGKIIVCGTGNKISYGRKSKISRI